MTHAINVEIRKFYKVYVDDEEYNKTDDEIIDEAKGIILDAEKNDTLDTFEDVELESLYDDEDRMTLSYGYAF